MKTFKQFLNEETDVINLQDWVAENAPEIIKPYLAHKKVFLRGMDSEKLITPVMVGDTAYRGGIISVRKDRTPSDMPLWAHEAIDSYFKDVFGVKARSEGLFCSSSHPIASSYGDTLVAVFPMHFKHAISSREVNDLYVRLFPGTKNLIFGSEYWQPLVYSDMKARGEFDDELAAGESPENIMRSIPVTAKDISVDEQIEALELELLELGYQDDIDSALFHMSETMLICDFYLAVEVKKKGDFQANIRDILDDLRVLNS